MYISFDKIGYPNKEVMYENEKEFFHNTIPCFSFASRPIGMW
jgi:hypothetical protein